MTGAIFSRVLTALAGVPVPRDLLTVRLMTKRYVHALVQHRDREIFLAGLWHITGFRQIPLPIVSPGKESGSFDAAASRDPGERGDLIQQRPTVCVFMSVFMLCASFLAALWSSSRNSFQYLPLRMASLIVSIWMLGGLTIFALA
jgi:putative glycosyltransferase